VEGEGDMSGEGGLRVVRGLGSETQSRSEKVKPKQPIGRLRSSNCNSDTIDGLPDWVVVEKQEYDLPKEVICQLYHCYKI